MTFLQIALLAGAGFIAGASNAVVGGGTLFSFPVLLGVGLPPIVANATSTVALWPASVAASTAYRVELRQAKEGLIARIAVALLGGLIGALLLLASGNELFFALVPWLLAIATLLFAFSTRIVALISRLGHGGAQALLPLILQFVFAIYGGYFGAGLGVLLMAGLALAGFRDAQIANAQKNLLGATINLFAALLFIVAGAVEWEAAFAVMAGGILGGFAGAHVARLIAQRWLRLGVIAVGAALSLIYFVQAYG